MKKNNGSYFIENKGQIVDQFGKENSDVKFLLNTPGLNVQLRENGFSYDIYSVKEADSSFTLSNNIIKDSIESNQLDYSFNRLDVDFIDANFETKIISLEKAKHYYNYYNVPNKEGITQVKNYKKIVYKNLYPSIDLEFFIPEDKNKIVEYNFIVHKEGNLSDIKMKFSGAKVNNCVSYLEYEMEQGILNETIPLSWADSNDGVVNLDITYNEIEPNIFEFKNNSFTPNGSKIIVDPTPVRQWGTYFGGEKSDSTWESDLSADSNENIILVGQTKSYTNIATTGSHQDTNPIPTTEGNPQPQGFMAKFDKDGILLWATYYGGNHFTKFTDVTVDSNDDIIGVGKTQSLINISTIGAHQETIGGNVTFGQDGFIVKFNSNGVRLWGSYYGGENFAEAVTTVNVDNIDNIYIAGFTQSTTNISTLGAYSEAGAGRADGFLAKFDKNGVREWGTYYGGEDSDKFSKIEIDSFGNIYLVGETHSRTGISTTGSFQEELGDDGNNHRPDIFLVKFNNSGERIWATYFGGFDMEMGASLAIDNLNNPIISGGTRSNENIAFYNSHQPNKGGDIPDFDTFLAKFNPIGELQWSTWYGGNDLDFWTAIASAVRVDVDSENNIYLAGESMSDNNISTPNAFQENNLAQYFDSFIAKFDPLGNRIWGTYLGSNRETHTSGLIIKNDNIYISGLTISDSGISTVGAHQENYGGYDDSFLVKFKDCLSLIEANATEFICENDNIEFNATGGDSYSWVGPNGFTSTDANPIIPTASVLDSGTYTVYIESVEGCSQTLEFEVLVSVKPEANPLDDLHGCEDNFNSGFSSQFDTSTIESQVLGTQTNMTILYFDGNGNALPSPLPNPMTNSIANNEIITVRVSNENNPDCYAETTFELIVEPIPEVFTIADIFECDDDTDGFANFDLSTIESTVLGGQTGMTVSYVDGSGNQLPNPLPNPYVNSIPNQETITVRVTNDTTDCYNETTFTLNVNELPIANPLDTLIGCDDNSDGISEYFDTTNVENQAIGSQSGMEVSYFDSLGNVLPNPLPNPFTNTEPNSQNITVRVANSQTGCYAETILTLETATQPNINQPDNLYACDEGNGFAHFDTSAIETVLIGSQTGLDIFYFDDNGNALPSPLPSSFLNTVAFSQTIHVKVENALNPLCYSETSFELIVNELPVINLEDDYLICNLDPSLTLSVAPDYYSYAWYYNTTDIVSETYEATLIEEGNYTLVVSELMNGIECENTFDFTLSRSVLPEIIEVEYEELGSNFIRIVASGDGDFEYSIDGINFQDSNYFNNISGGTYTAYVRDKYGCGEDTREVTLIDYPKFFTPNNDGYKDTWQIYGIRSYANSNIFIYDRYGKLLKQLSPNGIGWDGTFNGQPLNSNDFWFTVDLGNGKTFKGHFALKR